jgi:DNA-binding CsgD family transcriptional regulator
MLIGRGTQRAEITLGLDSACAARAATLRLVGAPGLGKTTLLDAAADRATARGMRVARLTALEIEQELHGAGLDLLMRLLGAAHLPATALGLLAALEAASRDAPLLLCLDDVQWLDAQTLAAVSFATRRLLADPVAVLLAGRPETDRIPALAAIPRVEVPALDEDDGVAVLRSVVPGMPEPTARRVARALAGVPLALHEVVGILPADVLAGRTPLPSPIPVGAAIQDRYAHGFDSLAPATRTALVLLATDATGDPQVLTRALHRLGLTAADLGEAESAGLVRLLPTPGFVHPLARAAVHSAAPPGEVRTADAALAAVLSERGDTAAALRHRAACTIPPDADLAAELEALAEDLVGIPAARAEAAEAALLAARFTPDPAERARLQVLAAETSGSPHSLALVRGLEAQPLPPDLRARCTFARVTYDDYAHPDEVRAALEALDALPLDPQLRHRLDDHLIGHAIATLDLAGVRRIAERIEADCGDGGRWPQLMAAGSAFMFVGDHRRAVPLLRRARDASAPVDPATLPLGLVVSWATIPGWLAEVDAEHAERFRRMDRTLRATGLPQPIATAAFFSSERARREGHWGRAEALLHESIDVLEASGQQDTVGQARLACLQAYRGHGVEVGQLVGLAREPLGMWSPWSGMWLTQAQGALHLSLGQPEQAVAVLAAVRDVPFVGRGARDSITACLVDLVESCVAVGDVTAASAAADDLRRRLDGLVDPLGRAFVARSRALVTPDTDAADALFAEALAQHDRTAEVFEAARTHLLWGEHLRRTRRPRESRGPLSTALGAFERLAADPWAQRAHRELGASGQRPAARPAGTGTALTPQEARVALAVADGLTNAEVAQMLFLSVKTVEFHLGRVYRKLDVRSRGGLARALAAQGL